MSFEVVNDNTVYAPLNTNIDGDRDYRDLTGLEACACGGAQQYIVPPGSLSEMNAQQKGALYVGGLMLIGWLLWRARPRDEWADQY